MSIGGPCVAIDFPQNKLVKAVVIFQQKQLIHIHFLKSYDQVILNQIKRLKKNTLLLTPS